MNQTSDNSILLIGINAKYIHSNPAIYSLKAYADKYYPDRPGGCSLEIAEYTINQPQGAILSEKTAGCRLFLLYLELEYRTGSALGAAQTAARHRALAWRTGGFLSRAGSDADLPAACRNHDRRGRGDFSGTVDILLGTHDNTARDQGHCLQRGI